MLKFQQKRYVLKKYFEILKKCPLFFDIKDDQLPSFLKCLGASVIEVKKDCLIFSEGERATHVGIMLKGSAQIISYDYFGNRSILGTISPSELFADEFACSDTLELPISIIADEECEIMLIECSRILHTCSSTCSFHQQMIFNLMKNLALKNLSFHQRADIISKRSTKEKLMSYLLMQAKKSGSNRFDIPFDRQELADFLEVDRSGLSTEIGKLKKQGIISNNKRHFELL